MHSQTSTILPLENGYVISSHTLLGTWLLIYGGMKKLNHASEKDHWYIENAHNRWHALVYPGGRDMEYLLCVQTFIYFPVQFLLCHMLYDTASWWYSTVPIKHIRLLVMTMQIAWRKAPRFQYTWDCLAYQLAMFLGLYWEIPQQGTGPRFTNVFFIAIQIRWKFRFTLISILTQWSLQNCVHGTTAMHRNYSKMFLRIWIAGKTSSMKRAPGHNTSSTPPCGGIQYVSNDMRTIL